MLELDSADLSAMQTVYVLVDASYSPMEIIAAATESVAYACGLSSKTGKVQPGFSTDLVAFAGNLLGDIEPFSQPSLIAPIGDLSEVKNLDITLLWKRAGYML